MGGRGFLRKCLIPRPPPFYTMGRKPYRLEVVYSTNHNPKCFIVKDVCFEDKRRKVKVYLRSGSIPNQEEFDQSRETHAFELETRAAKKIGEWSIEKFNREHISSDSIAKLEELKYLYKRFTQLMTANELEVYEKNFEISYIQGTTSIEGNTFSKEEAFNFYLHGIVPKNKQMREINEIQNFKNVKKFRDSYKGKVTFDFIKTLHALIMANIDDDSAGTFRRTDDKAIGGCDLPLCPSILIEQNLKKTIQRYYTNLRDGYHPLEQAILFHYTFEMIHPFSDGNGRVGREIFNYMLNKVNFPRLLFLGEDREHYIEALKFGNLDQFENMVEKFVSIVIDQRKIVLLDNLRKVVIPPKKEGQLRLTDFS